MGHVVLAEHSVDAFEADLEARGVFEHAGMLDQRGVSVRLELLQQLLFMDRCHSWWASRRPADLVQRPKTLLGEVGINGFKVNPIQPGDDLTGLSTLDRSHHPFPQIQTVPSASHSFHVIMMTNALDRRSKARPMRQHVEVRPVAPAGRHDGGGLFTHVYCGSKRARLTFLSGLVMMLHTEFVSGVAASTETASKDTPTS
ncbi:hypothetical protein M1R55_24540 (plasmid) [Deinococcus sp. QL22]|nr:hypothetical protein [Deinococcus sp. QL22]UQN09203.1 hypothetical protein M1R55_24540 [Deinococcus sp. QL22]